MVKIENRFDELFFDDWGKKAWKQFTITKNTSQWKAEQRKWKVSEAKPHHHQNWHPYLSAFQKVWTKHAWWSGVEVSWWCDAKNNGKEENETKQNNSTFIDLISSVCHCNGTMLRNRKRIKSDFFIYTFVVTWAAYVTCISCIGWRYRSDAHTHLHTETDVVHRVEYMFLSFNLPLVCLDAITVSLFILRFLSIFPLQSTCFNL